LDIAQWITLAKQYGPLVAFFIVFIAWQSIQIQRLLEKNSKIYDAEIERMAKVQGELLDRLLGRQPSSAEAPIVGQLKGSPDASKQKGGKQ
jgi:hypothetical protein